MAMSLIPACKAVNISVNNSVSPCWAVLAVTTADVKSLIFLRKLLSEAGHEKKAFTLKRT